jgi:hypothetical protein
MNASSGYTFKRFIWTVLAITALRILYLCFNHRNLDIEEAQYWAWSRHLALGYHSKPPMISGVIHFSTRLFGNGEWAVRLFSPLTYLGTALCIYGAGSRLYQRAIGFWAGITVLLLPGATYSATIISTDPFLILFWSLALYAFINACQTGRTSWWALCGVAIGLGLLSKYTMLLFFLSAGIYFICAVESASPLKKPGPYIALFIAAIIFSPNVWWNTQHHNAALHHVVSHNIHVQGVAWNWENLGMFLLGQAAILGPILLIFLVIALWRSHRLKEHRQATRLLLCFTLPTLIIICGEALFSRAYANWGAVAYPSGIILTVAYLWEQNFRRWLKLSIALNVLAGLLFWGWELAVAYGYCHWPLPAQPNWQDFGMAIVRSYRAQPNTVYLVDDRELWSKTLYYGKVPESKLRVWDPEKKVDWLDTSARLNPLPGMDFIFLSYNERLPSSLARSFKRYKPLGSLTVNQRLLGRSAHIYVYRLQGFVSYEQ